VNVHEEKLANSKQLLQELQAKNENLLHERDAAVTEAKSYTKRTSKEPQ